MAVCHLNNDNYITYMLDSTVAHSYYNKHTMQADLCDWIPALNVIDASINFILKTYPKLLLVAPVPRKNAFNNIDPTQVATSMDDVASVPQQVIDALCTILQFSCALLRNSINKNVYNSVEELAGLLAAADDSVASFALDCLCSLAIPPALHKQQAPEMHHHSTALHATSGNAHARLLALARGWGTRGSGLGLLHCVTTDDSEFGQGSLPTEAGQVHFEVFTKDQELKSVKLTADDVLLSQNEDRMDDGTENSKQKRRKTDSTAALGSRGNKTRSTAQLYFECVQQAGGRNAIPENRQFLLLADVRLAKAFYSWETRVSAIQN